MSRPHRFSVHHNPTSCLQDQRNGIPVKAGLPTVRTKQAATILIRQRGRDYRNGKGCGRPTWLIITPREPWSHRAVTARLKQTLVLMDVRLLDHLIVSCQQVFSMAAKGGL